jgi:hypothetical protein
MRQSKLTNTLKRHALTGLFLMAGILFFSPATHAQFAPPSVLPGDDANVGGFGDACINLATRIRTGDIHLKQIPCFIKFFSQTLIALAGTLSVIFVMFGGYQYIFAEAIDGKEKAKETITYALIGLVVTLSAWMLVDIVLQFVTE